MKHLLLGRPNKRISIGPWSVRVAFLQLLLLIVVFNLGVLTALLFGRSTSCSFVSNPQSVPIPQNSVQRVEDDENFLVIVIVSAPKNSERRAVIRETWLRLGGTHRRYRSLFVIGTFGLSSTEVGQLEREHSDHRDVLLLSHLPDSYHSLTRKLLLTMVWLSEHLSTKYEYVLKVDDDSLVRLDVLYDELVSKDSALSPEARQAGLYWGYFDGRAPVKRAGQWSETEWFLCDRYLPYALGGGYILSRNLAHYIATNSAMLKLYKSEDVSLGSWLAPLNVHRIHDIRFDTEYRSRGCAEAFLVQHKQSTQEMRSKYASLVERQQLCPDGESEKSLAYEYNWRVQPSKCCARNVSMLSGSL